MSAETLLRYRGGARAAVGARSAPAALAALAALAAWGLLGSGCASTKAPGAAPGSTHPGETLGGVRGDAAGDALGEALGEISRLEIEARFPELRVANAESVPDPYAAVALGEVEPGGAVEIYFGTWCADSRRLLPRLWLALDQLGGNPPPFAIRYIAIDRSLRQPAELLAGARVSHVPTVIVRRGGVEVGRIVESAPHGVESDLHALLAGVLAGPIQGRPTPPDGATLHPGGRR